MPTTENFELEITIRQNSNLLEAGEDEKILLTFGTWHKGDKGDDGKSAYDIWLEAGHEGTEEDFLEWLKADPVKPDWNAQAGSDAEILHKPEIGNATITLQSNGRRIDDFNANQKNNKTINMPNDTAWMLKFGGDGRFVAATDLTPSIVAFDENDELVPIIIAENQEASRVKWNPFSDIMLLEKKYNAHTTIDNESLYRQAICFNLNHTFLPALKGGEITEGPVYLILRDRGGILFETTGVTQDLKHFSEDGLILYYLGWAQDNGKLELSPTHQMYHYNKIKKEIEVYTPEKTAEETGALPDTTKYAAGAELSINNTTFIATLQLKDQDGNNIGNPQSIDLPLESVVVSGSYDNNTKKAVLELQNGSTVEFSLADLVRGLQSEITQQNKLSADLLEDGNTNKVFTDTEKTKLANIESGAQKNTKPDWNAPTGSEKEVLNKPTIPTVPAISTDIGTDKNDDTKTASPKAVYDHVKGQISHANKMLCIGGEPEVPSGQLLDEEDLFDDTVAIIYKDTEENTFKYLRAEDAGTVQVDTERYTQTNCVRFARDKYGRQNVIHAQKVASRTWAAPNKWILRCDFSSDGGFDFMYGNTPKTVSWLTADNPTLEDVITQIGTISALTFAVSGNQINITQNWDSTILALSNNTGGTLIDLSMYCQINGVQQTETHRNWRQTDVATMLPDLGMPAATTACYAVNGYNLSVRCGGNETQYKNYYRTNGNNAFLAETSSSGRMRESAFLALNGSGVAEQQALYDKYNGSWNAYMEASMANIDDENTNGLEFKYYNGDAAPMHTVTTMDFNGSYVPAFPIFAEAANVNEPDFPTFHLAGGHELITYMRNATMAKINQALSYIANSDALSRSSVQWIGAQCSSTVCGWFYYGGNGIIDGNVKNISYEGRRLAYL